MPTLRIARFAAAVAAVAVALAGALPAAHVHAGDDGQIVHQHAIADGPGHHNDAPGPHGGDVDQPNHAAARILTVAYEITGHVAALAPPPSLVLLNAPGVSGAVLPVRSTLLPTHDPPLRFVSSPAPPPA